MTEHGVSLNNEASEEKFLARGRQLDHKLRGEALLTGKDDTLRAGVTDTGFCIQYRESLFEHFDRIGRLFEKEPPILSHMEIGMTRGMKMYGMGMQGSKGDQTNEKPTIFDVLGGLKWDAWEDYRGIDSKFAQKMFIVYGSKVLVDEGLS